MEKLRQHYRRHLATKRRQARKGIAPVEGEYAQFAGTEGRRHVMAWVHFEDELDGKGWVHLPTAPERRPAPSGSSSERSTASPAPCCIRLKSKRPSHAFCTGRRSYQPPTPTQAVVVGVGYATRRPSRELTRSHCSPNSCGMSSRSTMQAHGPCETTLPLTMC